MPVTEPEPEPDGSQTLPYKATVSEFMLGSSLFTILGTGWGRGSGSAYLETSVGADGRHASLRNGRQGHNEAHARSLVDFARHFNLPAVLFYDPARNRHA